MDMNNSNKIYIITLSDYSEYDSSKCRNGGAYGYDDIFTYSPKNDSFTWESFSTCELTPDSEPSNGYSLFEVLAEMADFISRNADSKNCTVYINGIIIWESTPISSQDIDNSGLYLDD